MKFSVKQEVLHYRKSQPPKPTETASVKASTDGAKRVRQSKPRNATNLQQRVG